MLLPHLASRLYGTPLLLVRSKLDVILSVLGDRVQWPTAKEAITVPAPRANVSAAPGIALIPVYGTLVRRSLGLDAASGLTSYGQVAAMLDAALADASITGILLDIDSPGGEAGGVFELAQRIRAASAVKPVWAVASDSAFSAAYAIASAASRIYVSQTGGVGSIGVIAMHVDQTARDAQDGYRYTAVTAGAHKNDFSPHEPLDPTLTRCRPRSIVCTGSSSITWSRCAVSMRRPCVPPKPVCTSAPTRSASAWPIGSAPPSRRWWTSRPTSQRTQRRPD
jgi:ClpP class serine protease